MLRQAITASLTVMAAGAAIAAIAATPSDQAPSTAQTELPKVCKMVVSAEAGAKPYKLCMTKAEWDAKKLADAKDVNRQVCKYQEDIKTRFRSFKICMTAAEWERQRQEDRDAVDHIQRQSCVPGGGC